MHFKNYKCTCLKCGDSDILEIDNANHVVGNTDKKLRTNFMGYRWRPDLTWGFRCVCGNYSLLAPQEEKDFDKLVDGDPITIDRIARELKIPAENKFKLETA